MSGAGHGPVPATGTPATGTLAIGTASSGSTVRRATVAATLVVLLFGLGVAMTVAIPWSPLPEPGPVEADFSAAQLAREVAFHNALRPLSLTSLGLSVLVAAVLGLSRLGSRLLRATTRPLGRGWLWPVLLGPLVLAVLAALITLPLDLRAEQVLRDYGLSTRSWATFTADRMKGIAVSSALSALLLVIVVGLARRSPRRWWAWAAGAAAGLTLVGSLAYPVLVEPLFNDFRSLEPGPLRSSLLELAARDGLEVDDVLVADASRRTTALNAYVSGFGPTRRIVVYDTLLRDAPPDEVRLIAAHELGHAKELDVLTGTLLGALAAAAGVCAVALLLTWRPLLRRVGATGPGDPAVVPLLLLLVSVGGLLTAPVTNAASRAVEARADRHSLQLTGAVETFVSVERRLAVTNLSDLEPSPVLYTLFATHPSALERIALARQWPR